jgi:Transglutaminase-like superfamily
LPSAHVWEGFDVVISIHCLHRDRGPHIAIVGVMSAITGHRRHRAATVEQAQRVVEEVRLAGIAVAGRTACLETTTAAFVMLALLRHPAVWCTAPAPTR